MVFLILIKGPYLSLEILTYNSLDSTMDEAKRLLLNDVSLETIVLAKQQTGGRGRQSRPWVSPVGNLHMSVMTRDVDAAQLSQFALLWGVVVRQAISSYIGAQVQCKWPNDVLIEGQKVAGVLIERHESALVVGVGVNIAYRPEGVQFPATCLNDHGVKHITPEQLALKISDIYTDYREKWDLFGFDEIHALWLQSAWKLQQEINIRQDAGSVIGIFETIDATGALILKDAAGTIRKLYVGDLIEEVKYVTRN